MAKLEKGFAYLDRLVSIKNRFVENNIDVEVDSVWQGELDEKPEDTRESGITITLIFHSSSETNTKVVRGGLAELREVYRRLFEISI